MGVVITDGRSNIPLRTKRLSTVVKCQNVILIAIANGADANIEELETIATGEGSKNVFDFGQLGAFLAKKDELILEACNGTRSMYDQ